MTILHQVSMKDLTTLVRHAKHPDVDSFDALMKALFGLRHTAMKVFQRLLRWLPHTSRADGMVYKSAKELARETACSTASVDRARPHLVAVGFEIVVKKANGAPTNHYRLNVTRFVERLAVVFQTSAAQIRAWMWGEPLPDAADCGNEIAHDDRIHHSQGDRNGGIQDDRIDSIKVGPSITQQNTALRQDTPEKTPTQTPHPLVAVASESTDHPVNAGIEKRAPQPTEVTGEKHPLFDAVEAFAHRLGTDMPTLESWILSYGWERVHEVMEQAAQRKAEGKIIKNVMGWVYSALNEGYTWKKADADNTTSGTDTSERGSRYISGKYAEFIQH